MYDVQLDELRFDRDPRKAAANRRKHAVSFEEASTVFADEHALLLDDPDHSSTGDRFVILGMSHLLRVLVVCHCYRESNEIIRIITARRASRQESQEYFSRWSP